MTQDSEIPLNSNFLPALSSGNIHSYITAVFSIPSLSREEEIILSKKLVDENCLESAKKLVLSHLKYVVHVAKGFKNYKMPEDELIQEGNIGLMKAVKRFSPDKGARLVTFAHHWIYAEIADYVVRNFRQVKIATTKAQRKLFFNLRKLKKATSWMKDSEIKDIADKLDVLESDVRQMEGRLSMSDSSFSYSSLESGDDTADKEVVSPEEYLGTTYLSGDYYLKEREEFESKSVLYSAIDSLDDRSKDIIQSRWLNEDSRPTLHDLADKYGVSAERVRQLEVKAMKKMKAELSSDTES